MHVHSVSLTTEANAFVYSFPDAVFYAFLDKGQSMDRWNCRHADEPKESVASMQSEKTATVHCWAGCASCDHVKSGGRVYKLCS